MHIWRVNQQMEISLSLSLYLYLLKKAAKHSGCNMVLLPAASFTVGVKNQGRTVWKILSLARQGMDRDRHVQD